MEKFERQQLVKKAEIFHQTSKEGYETKCKEIWKLMDDASSSGQKSIQYPLGHRTSHIVREFLDYIKERFPESDGYHYSRTMRHISECGCEDSFPCTEFVIIKFL